MRKQPSLFDDLRLSLDEAVELSIDSLREHGGRYPHWATAYSGGKDSTALVTFAAWAIRTGRIAPPKTWMVLLADTRMELPPLISSAIELIDHLRRDGVDARVVLPAMDDRLFVYMFGRGVPPPKNRFRWCTPQLKIYPMQFALEDEAAKRGMGEILETDVNRYGRKYVGSDERLLMLTGVRLGESAARDRRISIACNKDSGECGTGWMHVKDAPKNDDNPPGMFVRSTPGSVADTLAPLLHWRLCNIFDWLYETEDRHGFDEVRGIAAVYGMDDIRTGCVGCNLASRDTALERLLAEHPARWGHLQPLTELKPLYAELKRAKYRLRKSEAEIRKDGKPSKNAQRLGPLTMEARAWGLHRVLDIQRRVNDAANGRPGIDLINTAEEARIRELWSLNTWPNGWSGSEIVGDVPIDSIVISAAGEIISQPLLI